MLGVIAGLAEVVGGGDNPRAPAKMKIIVEGSNGKLEGGTELKLPHMFNPVDMKINRAVTWDNKSGESADATTNAQHPKFNGGTDKLTFTLVFDASEEAEVDLSKELEALYDLTFAHIKIKGTDGFRAPVLRVKWNDFLFTGVALSVNATVTLFDPKGRFKRATVEMTLEGFAYDKGKTTGSSEDYFTKPREKQKAAAADSPPEFGSSNPFSTMGF